MMKCFAIFSSSDCSIDWILMENSHSIGALNSPSTSLSLCQTECTFFTGCDGIDWVPGNGPGQRCWLSGPWIWGWENKTARGVSHFILNVRCRPGSTFLGELFCCHVSSLNFYNIMKSCVLFFRFHRYNYFTIARVMRTCCG